MLAGWNVPFKDNEAIKKGYYKPGPIDSYSNEFKEIIAMFFKVDPKERDRFPEM